MENNAIEYIPDLYTHTLNKLPLGAQSGANRPKGSFCFLIKQVHTKADLISSERNAVPQKVASRNLRCLCMVRRVVPFDSLCDVRRI